MMINTQHLTPIGELDPQERDAWPTTADDTYCSPRPTRPARSSFAHCTESPKTPCTPTRPLWLQRCEAASIRCPYPCSFSVQQNLKGGKPIEDKIVVDCRGQDALWAVFDGHLGAAVSGHASQNVANLVWASSQWPASPGDALRNVLVQCHELARSEDLKGGSTALVVAVTNGRIWCSSAGDSRSVAGLRSGGVRRLSVDHTTSVPAEIARIQAMGASLEWGRLGGCLPMTRGLGNFAMEADGFACLPDIDSVSCSEVDFVILASDGLWDHIDDEAACCFVRSLGVSAAKHLGTHVGCAAEQLCALARRAGSQDDLSVIVAYFPPERVPLAFLGGAGA